MNNCSFQPPPSKTVIERKIINVIFETKNEQSNYCKKIFKINWSKIEILHTEISVKK